MVFKQFVVICGRCGHRNVPDRSPRKGIALALLGKLLMCRGGCGHQLQHIPDRPLVDVVRRQLIVAGFLAEDGSVIDPPPASDPLKVVAFRKRSVVVSVPSGAYADNDFCSEDDFQTTDEDLDW